MLDISDINLFPLFLYSMKRVIDFCQQLLNIFLMPLNAKGKKIKSAMRHHYGSKEGDRVFYASENAGTIKGVTLNASNSRKRNPHKIGY